MAASSGTNFAISRQIHHGNKLLLTRLMEKYVSNLK
jgi:hypothetical protein